MKTSHLTYLLFAYIFTSCNFIEDKNPDFLLETLFVNNDERLLNYDAVSDADREACFIEEFDNNDLQWPGTVGRYSDAIVCIDNGKMSIDFFENKNWVYHKPIPLEIDINRNFEMETNLLIRTTDSINQNLLYMPNSLEIDDTYNYLLSHYLDKNDKNEIYKTIFLAKAKEGQDWENLYGYDFHSEDFFHNGEFTTLTIRKIGEKYAIFINRKLFYIINDKKFRYYPGITYDHKGHNEFDYFRIYYLK